MIRTASDHRVRRSVVAVILASAAVMAVTLCTSAAAWADTTANTDSGLNVLDLLEMGPADFLGAFLTEFMVGIIQYWLSPLVTVLFDWSIDFTTIPFVNTLIIWLQVFALSAVIAVRIFVGVKDHIILNGGNKETSTGEYIFKSLIAIAFVALMPMMCRTVIQVGMTMYGDVTGNGSSLSDHLQWFSFGDNFQWSAGNGTGQGMLAAFCLVLSVLVILVLCIACGYQFLRRQIEMIAMSIIAPLVSIYAATENDSDQAIAILKQMFGLVCLQWLQYVLVLIALGFGETWIAVSIGAGTVEPFGSAQAARYFMLCLASFGAALTVPALVDEYTAPSRGSRTGGIVVGAAIGAGVRGVGRGAVGVVKRP